MEFKSIAFFILSLGLVNLASSTEHIIPAGFDLTQIPFDIGQSGDHILISPGIYTTPLNVIGQNKTFVIRPQNIASPPVLSMGTNIINSAKITIQDITFKREINIRNSNNIIIMRNTVEVVGYSTSPGGSFQWGAIIVADGCRYVTLRNNTVKNAFVGIAIGGSATLPNGGGIQVVSNIITNIYYHGIVVGNILLTDELKLNPLYLLNNRIFNNGGHGIEFMGRYGDIEYNVIRNNGFNLLGTSGIHIFSHSAGREEQCNDNIVQYNFVSEQKDRSSVNTSSDGNGIQIDHFCKRNLIQYNVVWNNDGPGINIYAASNNTVRSNTAYNNFQHTTRSPWSGRGEIILSAPEMTNCNASNPSQTCVYVPRPDGSGTDLVPFPNGGASNNKIYNNVVYSTRNEQPGLLISWGILNPTWNNLMGSVLGPNLYRSNTLSNNLWWGAGCPGTNTFTSTSPCWRSTEVQIDSTTSSTGNRVEAISFQQSNNPVRPYHGLRLVNIPAKKGVRPAGVLPTDISGFNGDSCAVFFGAYYYTGYFYSFDAEN